MKRVHGLKEKSGEPLSVVIGEARKLLEGRRILVTAHKNADPDAVASSIVFRNIARKAFRAKPVLALPEGINSASRSVLQTLGIDYSREVLDSRKVLEEKGNIEAVVVVDTASKSQLGDFAQLVGEKPVVVIDHHQANTLLRETGPILGIYDPSAKAAAEIVYRVARHVHYELDSKEAELLLSGIVYDTKRFAIASPETFSIASDLLRLGANIARVVGSLSRQMDISERIARLKAAQRMELLRAGEIIVAVTRVSAFEGSAAGGIMSLGADMVLILSPKEKEGEVRVIGRANQIVTEKLGISLGADIIQRLIGERKGRGGGHAAAAGAIVPGGLEKVKETLIGIVKEVFREKGFKLEPLEIEKEKKK